MDANNRQGGCEHICIPKFNKATKKQSRVCKCSLGYTIAKPQNTDCYPAITKPPYLIFADVDHGLMFQMSLNPIDSEQKLDKLTYVHLISVYLSLFLN